MYRYAARGRPSPPFVAPYPAAAGGVLPSRKLVMRNRERIRRREGEYESRDHGKQGGRGEGEGRKVGLCGRQCASSKVPRLFRQIDRSQHLHLAGEI